MWIADIVFINVLIILYIVAFVYSGAANTRFFRIPNKRFKEPFESHVLSSATCVAMCARIALCGSVSYRERDKTCWLTSGDRCGLGDDSVFLDDTQWDVYAPVHNVPVGEFNLFL